MSTSRKDPVHETAEPDSGVRRGVDTYARSLRIAGGDQVEALVRGEHGRGVGAALYRAPPFEVRVPALPVCRLSVNLTHTRVGGCIDGERVRYFESRRYALFLTPVGAPMVFRKDVPSRHINIYFHADSFDDGDTAASPLAVAQPLFNVAVPGIRGLTDQLVEEMQNPVMLNADAADSLARLLLVHVARHLRRASAKSPMLLSPAVLARLREYVMAHLSERILVADLARQSGLSLDRFATTCKAQTGRSPHQLVLALRLERAADLLTHSRMSVAEVAHACGFASQQHLTNVMHSHLGSTPRRFRESTRAR